MTKNYLLPEADGLPARPSGQWAKEKLDYLGRYISIFETSMRNKPWRKRNYIDLFAGPGKCLIGETGEVCLGSPLLALTTKHPFTDYFFVDQDPHNIAALKERCSASSSSENIHYLVGDSNDKVQTIVASIIQVDNQFIQGKLPSLNLAFLDPEGLELEWSSVASLAQVNRMDLIIHYSQGGLNRSMKHSYSAGTETSVDRFFGDREWRKVYQEWCSKGGSGRIHRQLVDYYKSKLQALGYKDVRYSDETGDEPLMRNAKRNAPLYRLLFASKHELGHNFWKQVTRRNVYGQKRLF
jgi:three-Cys-motif partner protein